MPLGQSRPRFMSLGAFAPAVCECCGDFSGLDGGGSEKALIPLAALGTLAAAESNPGFNPPSVFVFDHPDVRVAKSQWRWL